MAAPPAVPPAVAQPVAPPAAPPAPAVPLLGNYVPHGHDVGAVSLQSRHEFEAFDKAFVARQNTICGQFMEWKAGVLQSPAKTSTLISDITDICENLWRFRTCWAGAQGVGKKKGQRRAHLLQRRQLCMMWNQMMNRPELDHIPVGDCFCFFPRDQNYVAVDPVTNADIIAGPGSLNYDIGACKYYCLFK